MAGNEEAERTPAEQPSGAAEQADGTRARRRAEVIRRLARHRRRRENQQVMLRRWAGRESA